MAQATTDLRLGRPADAHGRRTADLSTGLADPLVGNRVVSGPRAGAASRGLEAVADREFSRPGGGGAGPGGMGVRGRLAQAVARGRPPRAPRPGAPRARGCAGYGPGRPPEPLRP